MHVRRDAHAYKRTFVMCACPHKTIAGACARNGLKLLSTAVRDVIRTDISRIIKTECPPGVKKRVILLIIASICSLLHTLSVGVCHA